MAEEDVDRAGHLDTPPSRPYVLIDRSDYRFNLWRLPGLPLARFEKMEPDRRQRLLRAAAKEFVSEGFEKASLGRIAEGAGVSKAALYYYFEDKADLYATVVRAAWERVSPEGRLPAFAALDAPSFWPAVEKLRDADLALCREEPWLAVGELAYHPPGEAAGAVAQVFDRARAFLRGLVRRGQELEVVRRDVPEELLIAMLTAVDAAAHHWMVDHRETLGTEEVERIARAGFTVVRAILSPAAPAPGGPARGRGTAGAPLDGPRRAA
jgi:AcrR family transcriptional regulator